MKKTLAWVLLFVMLLGMFAGCKKQDTQTPTTAPTGEVVTASDAMEYVKAIYPNTEEPLKTAIDYERMGVVRISDIPFTVVWTTDLSEDLIKIVPSEDGTVVTIDVNEQCEADTPYVLTATITDAQGNTATHNWNYVLPKAVDMVSIVEQAYALKKGESLPFECTLIGKIVSIDKPYDPDYRNITVTIAVAGAENKPIMCYRLKGDGAENLLVGNIITVTGTIKNYNGTIEFDAGCILEAVEKGDAVEAPTDVGAILKAAYKLKKGKALPYVVTLTGEVTEIDKPYDPGYKNISVVIEMEGYSKYPILCYRMKGKDAENVAVGDTITVTGIIKNYNGTIEFDAGCQMTKRVSGGGVAQKPSSDQNKILRDAKKLKEGQKLAYIATLTGEVISVDDAYSSQYKNVTVTMVVAGTKIQCYRMKGDDASKVRVTDKITVTGQIENYYGKLEFGSGCTLDKWVKGSRVVKIDMGPLKENTAYKMEMKLPTLGKNVYFNGKISDSHYLQTGTYDKAVEVMMEKTEKKGVRFFFMDGDKKTYIEIKLVDVEKDGKTEKKARPQLTTSPSVYWTYSEDAGVYTVDINGTKYYLGTYLNNGTVYETASCSSIYYITDSNAKNKGKTQFYFEFVTKASDAPEVPEEEETPTITGLPAYNAELKTGDKVVIYAPAYSKALSASKVNAESYYNKGVDLTVKNKALSGYGNTEIWTVTVNTDGTVIFANGGKNIGLADDYSSMNLGAKHDDWQLISLGNGLYNIKNVGRGNCIEWYADKDNWSTYGASDAATNKLFQLSIYVIGKGVLTQAADEPETPDTPAVNLPDEDGAVVSIADAIAAGQAMAHNTYTEKKYKVTGEITEVYQTTYGNMKIKDAQGNILTIYGTYDATGEIRYDALEVKPVAGDTVTIYGPIGQYNGTSQIKNGWIVEHIPAESTDPDQPDIPDTPETPEAPFADGDKIVIYAPAYNKALSMDKVSEGSYYNKGVAITVTNGVVSGYGDAEVWTVVANSDGSYSFTGKDGKNIGMQDSYATLSQGAVNDDWQLVVLENGTYALKNTVRGNHLQWSTRFSNYSTYTGDPATDDQYQLSFYVIVEETPENPDTPDTPDTPDEPETPEAPIANGDKVVIYAPAYNKALSMDKISEGSYYNKGVDITVTEGVVSGYGDAEVWTVVANSDGSYSFTGKDGQNIGMQESYATLSQGAVNDDWELVVLENGTYALKNTVRGNHLQWSTRFSNYSTYTGDPATDDQYQLSFFVIEEETPDIPETPETPEIPATPVLPEEDGAAVSIADALAAGAAMEHNTYTEKKYKVTGEITEVYNTQYGNMKIKDAEGNILTIYGTYNATGEIRYDAMDVKPVAGDTVTIYGPIGQYNGTAQIKNGWIVEHIPAGSTPETPDTPAVNLPTEDGAVVSIADALAAGAAMEHNTYTEKKYKVTGEITEVYNTQYGNMKIKDAEGNILTIYGTYNATGEIRYDAMDVKPVAGDTVTIYGPIGQYNGTAQIKNGWIVAHTPAEGTEPEQPDTPEEPETPAQSGYIKVTDASQLTTGKYVMVVKGGFAPGTFDGSSWVTAVKPVISDNTVTDTANGVWTLTFNGSSVTITDANGTAIAPKGGNNNGIKSGSYAWTWSFENGVATFKGVGSDTVILASNTGSSNKFRAYKTSTVSGNANGYPSEFTLYKLIEN